MFAIRSISVLVLLLVINTVSAQSKYEANGLLKLIGITEGSDQFKEALDSLGPFEMEEYPGGIMKKYRNPVNGINFIMMHRLRKNSPSKTFHLDELEITLDPVGNGYKKLLPLEVFTIIGLKEQHKILSSRKDIIVHKKKSRKGHINGEYTGYQNARLDGNITFDLSYIENVLFMMVIGH